ncbi:MAG: NAD(P)/FAD-dependent oxidoreductase [Chloroflexi bacterium]|nr:NAD(P)/FAD-dependent oxidoreductase [Chloroflexota bacterium]MYD47401.1 NAD(P)/FAD-dependent oxidoreductase [Chloroflexota bacterium]
MVISAQESSAATQSADGIEEVDVIVIGAGVTGLYSLYRLRNLGFTAISFEEGDGVGGTWYWNRYPGARFDSESYTYGYFFSEELLQEWEWKEHYSAQPENERYLNYVADKFDLRRHIRFESRVASLVYNEASNRWTATTDDGYQARSQFVITAIGILSARYVPDFEGLESYEGVWTHTNRWPKEGIDMVGKRVGIIGTGATAVQLIPEIAKDVAHLTVFQRTPNFCVPLRNSVIDDDTQAYIKSHYPEIYAQCMSTAGSFMHMFDPRSAFSVSEEEKMEQYERLWAEPGFKKWLANFYDVMMPGEANEDYAEFVRNKIRERVHDPEVAEMLVPKNHMFGSKRLPCESGYYEVYNQDNVRLVDVRQDPIARITPRGLQLTGGEDFEFDALIFATGYDAVTGPLNLIHIEGIGGEVLKEKFANGPRTFMGMSSYGYPNLFTINAASVGNFPRSAEPLVEWVTDTVAYVRDNGHSRIQPTKQAEDDWVQHMREGGEKILRTQADSWFVGANIPGKARVLLTAPDTAPVMRAKRAEVAANDYEGFTLD